MSRPRVLPTVSLVSLLALGSALPVPAGAAPTTATVRSFVTPVEDRFFDECADGDDTNCIISVEIRRVGDADFVAADESVMAAVTYEPNVDLGGTMWSVWIHPGARPGALELDPELPAGTSFRVAINSGDVAPAGHMWSFARNVTWTRSQTDDGDWVQTFEFTSTPRSVGGDLCVGSCVPTDYASVAQLAIAELGAVKSEPELSALAGSVVAGNYDLAPTIIDGDSQTITWWGFGPPSTAAGDPNIGWVESFVPNALLQLFFGLNAQGVVDSNGVTVRAGDASGEPVTSRMTVVPGGLRIEVEGFRILDQDSLRSASHQRVSGGQFVLRGKRMAPAPLDVAVKGGKRRAVVTADPVRKARGYQALCYRKSTRVYRAADTPRIVVRSLAPGRWRCQIRAMRATGGYWSRTVRTTVVSTG
jgi:hypothetical protein